MRTKHRNKYGCSKNVTKNEWQLLTPNKLCSFGKVKSYGSVTTVINSLGLGSQGSPVFNEMGKCWGMIINSYTDIPERWAQAVASHKAGSFDAEERELIKDIDKRIRDDDHKRKRKRERKEKKKLKKEMKEKSKQ